MRRRLWALLSRAYNSFSRRTRRRFSGIVCCTTKQSFSCRTETCLVHNRRRARWPYLGAYVLREGLAPLLIKLCAFLAQRLSASAFPQILFLDIVARVAVGVVVMHGLLNRVPGGFLRHLIFLLSVTKILINDI